MVGSTFDAVHPPLAPPFREGDLGFVSRQFDFFEDGFDDAVSVLHDIVVPETDHAVAVGFDDLGPYRIGGAARVLASVTFDGEAQAAAGEVRDEVSDRVLAGELDAQLFCAQSRPQTALGIGHVASQFARYAGQSLFHCRRTPIPNPFPQGKGLCIAKAA